MNLKKWLKCRAGNFIILSYSNSNSPSSTSNPRARLKTFFISEATIHNNYSSLQVNFTFQPKFLLLNLCQVMKWRCRHKYYWLLKRMCSFWNIYECNCLHSSIRSGRYLKGLSIFITYRWETLFTCYHVHKKFFTCFKSKINLSLGIEPFTFQMINLR